MTRRHFVQYTRNALFRNIPRELLRQEKVVSSTISAAPGTVIFEEGDPPDYCYLVGGGAVRISKALPDGQDELLAMIEPGDFFGELALFDSSLRSARATAAVPTRLGRVDLKAFAYLREVAPLQIASCLAERTIDRVRQTNIHLVTELAASGRLSSIGSELGILAHDLRVPLATIRNAADILYEWVSADASSRPDTARFVDMIRDTANKGLLYSDYVMARLKGESGEGKSLVSTEVLLQDLRQVTGGYFISPVIHYRDDNVPFRGEVAVERSEFVAALANLVKNAVEALPADGGDIDVSVAVEGTSVVFSVSDTGAGIPPELLPMIFEKRFTHGKKGGTGLGLSHVRTVAERHGGQAYVESEVGRGTTIRVRIPSTP
jgi:signal transduction histidine kinase